MITIYKYKADPMTLGIELPHYVIKLLDIQIQYDDIVCWAVVDTEKEPNYRGLVPIGTGWDLEDLNDSLTNPNQYYGTIQYHGFVWHYFLMPPINK